MVVSGITATSISLSWSVASGSVARSEVVWRETDRGTESSSGSLTGTSYTIDQLESTTIYTVTVRASNVAGTTDSQLITFSTGRYSKFFCVYQLFAIITASDVSDVCEAENKATESCDCSETDNTAAITGGVVVAVALIVAVTVIVIVILVLRSRSGSYSTSKTRQVN